ncbi:54S ribosomal protein L39 mitochondrial-like isoform X1 [Tripterygium wilfordii]|uniref:50S ribosomal protein L33, chloroplastic n=1 Tax=Tripterygium wilfordii TaxID=458696 RepID=A0A7J7CXR3_TRIWF|nr:54S ribosomal protein L39 mitochondrial-like isoform X1 [Tripterygium wilfordii]
MDHHIHISLLPNADVSLRLRLSSIPPIFTPFSRKKTFMFIRLVSAAGTGFFYVKRKSSKRVLDKLEFRKYDPRVNRYVLFTEAKMK